MYVFTAGTSGRQDDQECFGEISVTAKSASVACCSGLYNNCLAIFVKCALRILLFSFMMSGVPTSVVVDEDAIKALTKKFEAEHEECVRVLPYKDKHGHLEVHLYVYTGKSGRQEDLKAAARECFGEMCVSLEWLDLYNKGSTVLNVSSVKYPSGKPNRLEAGKVDEISKIISKNLGFFSNHRNITSVQPSFKVKESEQKTDPCIAIYVLGKGRIPLSESEIPQTVDGCLVDIVDGFWFEAVETWIPNEAQRQRRQDEALPWGISIGVEGVEASGTLGAIVEDENNPGVLYALSCDHVLNSGTEQGEIVHPGLNDYKNNVRCKIQQFKALSGYIPGPNRLNTESIDDLHETEKLLAKLENVTCVNERNMDLLKNDQTDPHSIPFSDPEEFRKFYYFFKDGDKARKNRVANLQKKVSLLPRIKEEIEQSLETKTRTVAKYTTGIRGNESIDGKRYFIDAAIAELSEDEVEKLKDSVTTEIIGTVHYPNGICTPATREAIVEGGNFCKSGRTTEYTQSSNLIRYATEAPTYLQTKLRWEGELPDEEVRYLPDVNKRYYVCQGCANETQNLLEVEGTPYVCEACGEDRAFLYETRWLENVLCIASEQKAFAESGDSGSVIFKVEESGDGQQNDCLTGFGLLFGVFFNQYKSCALASPLEISLRTLSAKVSDSCKLRLVSNYYS